MAAKTVLITGASRGIGREVATTLAAEGWHVLSGVRDLRSAPPGTQAETLDVADPASIDGLAEEAPDGYGASKAALDAMTRLFAEALRSRGILVNAISPGWVRTDMGGPGAPRSLRQGAASVLWGLRLPPGGPTGGVFEDGAPRSDSAGLTGSASSDLPSRSPAPV